LAGIAANTSMHEKEAIGQAGSGDSAGARRFLVTGVWLILR
jgi:hypothetical protein